MNKTHSTLALVLDRSGSMASCLEAAISSTNTFLNSQQQSEGTADLTITLFDDHIEQPFVATNVSDIPVFDTNTFVPRGSTALLDAIGHTIDQIGERLAAMPENDRPGTVIIAILTDGQENASQKHSWKTISAKISHQQDNYNWEFLFLAAGPDAIAQAGQMGIHTHNTSAFANDSVGYESSSAAYGQKISALRASANRPLRAEEARIKNTPLQDLVREEDEKRR